MAENEVYNIIMYDLNGGKGFSRNADNTAKLDAALASHGLDGIIHIHQVNNWLDPLGVRSGLQSNVPGMMRILEEHLDEYSAIVINASADNYQSALELAQLAFGIAGFDPKEKIFVYGNNLPEGNYTKINMSPKNGYMDQSAANSLAAELKKIIK